MSYKNSLSIYLLKEGITKLEDIFDDYSSISKLDIGGDKSEVYYSPRDIIIPKWVRTFFLSDDDRLKQASSQVVFIKRLNIDGEDRVFALLFGYSRHLLKADSIENRFGLKIVLNSIKDNELRKISKTSIGTNNKRSEEQLPKGSDIQDFGFDVIRDLIKGISARTTDELFGKCMISGNDSFNITIDKNIRNVDEFLIDIYRRYKSENYLQKFKWVDNISEIKSKSLKEELNNELIRLINNKEFESVWMAVPEVIDWEAISCFRIPGDKTDYFDIEIENVTNSFKEKLTDISQLKKKSIKAISSKTGEQSLSWSAFNCIVGQVTLRNNTYCISDGNWFLVNEDYVNEINSEYNNIELLEDSFIDYIDGELEDGYNKRLKDSLPNSIETHKMKISVPGNRGDSIEPCDILYNNMFIHVKRNSGSQSLGHLFNQGYASARTLLVSKDLYKKFKDEINKKANAQGSTYRAANNMVSKDYCVVFAIINKFNNDRPKIPFFSKVALSNIYKEIRAYGYDLKLKNIKIIKENHLQ